MSSEAGSPADRPQTKRARSAAHPSPGSRRARRQIAGKSIYDKAEHAEVVFNSKWWYLCRVVTGVLEAGGAIAVKANDGIHRAKVRLDGGMREFATTRAARSDRSARSARTVDPFVTT